jgi:hypothetical protein
MNSLTSVKSFEVEPLGLASTKTELAEKLKAIQKPLSIEELQRILGYHDKERYRQ